MSSIVLIQNPLFLVDLSCYQSNIIPSPPLSTSEKVKHIAAFALKSTTIFFAALGESIYNNVRLSGTSFKHIVLGYYGSLKDWHLTYDLSLIILKIAIWILGMGLNIALMTRELWINRVFSKKNENSLKDYIDPEINIAHIRTNDLTLDTTRLPSGLKIHFLANIFKDINFNDPNKPGYMPPSTRREKNTIYTEQQLENSLNVFIERVNKREAFIGTPPLYDTPRLMAFYQQIEDAVRLSIHRLECQLIKFKNDNGNDVSQYTPIQLKEYQNILEDRARMAIDLAIAGQHCGARYMGESMTVYFNTIGEDLSRNASLEESLVEILANKRKAIAQMHIQTYLGNDTHHYGNYMGTLGALLGIPGTKHVIEQLSFVLDLDKFKTLFFADYTVNAIIETIQEKVKSSNLFREKIIDWLKGQIKGWSHLTQQEVEALKRSILDEIEKIIQKPNDKNKGNSSSSPLENMHSLLLDLKKNQVSLPSFDNGWDDFIENLMGLEKTKQWCHDSLEPLSSGQSGKMGNVQKRNAFKIASMEGKIGFELVQKLTLQIQKEGVFDKELLVGKDNTQKIEEIKAVFIKHQWMSPPEDTIKRMISKEAEPENVVEGIFRSVREMKFLEGLDLDDLHIKGLRPEVIEWVLVSQNILMPQRQLVANKNPSHLDASKLVSKILTNFQTDPVTHALILKWIDSFKMSGEDEIEKEADEILKKIPKSLSARYQSAKVSKRDQLLRIIFMKSYQHSPLQIIEAFEEMRKYHSGLTHLKNVIQIKIPRAIASTINCPYFQWPLRIASYPATILATLIAYNKVKQMTLRKVIPFCVNQAPPEIVRLVNRISSHAFSVLVLMVGGVALLTIANAALMFGSFCSSLNPTDPTIKHYLSFIPKIKKYVPGLSTTAMMWKWILGGHIGCFLADQRFFGIPALIMDMSNNLANYCNFKANEVESQRLRSTKEKALPIWLSAMG